MGIALNPSSILGYTRVRSCTPETERQSQVGRLEFPLIARFGFDRSLHGPSNVAVSTSIFVLLPASDVKYRRSSFILHAYSSGLCRAVR